MKKLFLRRSSGSNFAFFSKFLIILAIAITATGCSRDAAKKPATQVAARINGHEITVHQINDVFARQNLDAGQDDAVKRQILDRLIDQEIQRQQAVEKKLDRNPRTVQTLEAAKTEILARAYVEQVAASLPKPTADEVKKYYDEHPELFADRRLYSVEELAVPQKHIAADALKERVGKLKDLSEVAIWLSSQKVEPRASRGVRAAEQVPLKWLPEVRRMKEGEMRVFETPGGANVIRLVATRSAPVDAATAAPRIEQFLFNQLLGDRLADEVKHLREKSDIQYLGEFAGKPGASTASAPDVFQPEPGQGESANFEKGIKGLR